MRAFVELKLSHLARLLAANAGAQEFQNLDINTQAPRNEQAALTVPVQPRTKLFVGSMLKQQERAKMSTSNQNNSNQNGQQQSGAVPSSFPGGFQAIATAYGDYTKKSFEDTKSFVEKLSSVKSFDKAVEVQTEFAKTSYETFVAESQKIAALYSDLAKQSYKPFGGFSAKMTSADR